MRVLAVAFIATGGDFHPVIALCLGLRARGNDVVLFCDPAGAAAVASTGLETIVDPEAWEEISRAQDGARARMRATVGDERDRIVVEWMVQRAGMLTPAFLGVVLEQRPDLVLSAQLAAPTAHDAAAAAGVPSCFVNASYDTSRTDRTRLGEWIATFWADAPLVLHASDALFDEAVSIPGRHYVGPLMWEPLAAVPAYVLDDGPPWALVTVSLVPQGDIALVPVALAALADLGMRSIATIGDRNDPAAVGALPAGAHLERSVSHAAVLERASLFVGHAGHGGVSKAMWHGVPMVLVPWGRDQPGVAARAERLGVARVVPPSALASLPDAIRDVLGDERYRQRATAQATRLHAHDPVALACDIIEARFRPAATMT